VHESSFIITVPIQATLKLGIQEILRILQTKVGQFARQRRSRTSVTNDQNAVWYTVASFVLRAAALNASSHSGVFLPTHWSAALNLSLNLMEFKVETNGTHANCVHGICAAPHEALLLSLALFNHVWYITQNSLLFKMDHTRLIHVADVCGRPDTVIQCIKLFFAALTSH
jgi:hypothetical protein